jgi:DNA-directed RNA polymerase subunit RPC12/RpoP
MHLPPPWQEGPPWEEPEDMEWRPPLMCPACGSDEVALAAFRDEFMVYRCERCQTLFQEEA